MAEDRGCIAIKNTGEVCGRRCRVGNVRCLTHITIMHRMGPNAQAVRELGYIHKKQIKDIKINFDDHILRETDETQRLRLIQDEDIEIRGTRIRQQREKFELHRRQQDEINRTGVDPDEEARQRRRANFERRHQQHERLDEEDGFDEMVERREFNNQNRVVAVAVQHAAPHVGELAHFANDNQNVHRTASVIQTKQIVNQLLRIPVPSEYKWNRSECSKTPGEITMTCHLTPKAAWQMFSKYCQDESIYELGKGIYGKVLDGVWQYILGSPDKTDLCRVLRQEMEDNIGMCAQGNLSRLCNILAGYMEGIGSQESTSEVLGRLMPKLMEIEDLSVRLNEAHKILKDNHVPFVEWKDWVDALMIDQDIEMAISFIKNSQDEIIGIFAVVG